jgi:hypothetical protein
MLTGEIVSPPGVFESDILTDLGTAEGSWIMLQSSDVRQMPRPALRKPGEFWVEFEVSNL